MILDTKVPVIATMQANRKAAGHENANLDEIAFSDAISQDCTMAIRVINEKASPTIALVFGGAREINFEGLRIHGIPATNFDFHSTLTRKEIEKAKREDSDDSGKRKVTSNRLFKLQDKPSESKGITEDPNYKSALRNL